MRRARTIIGLPIVSLAEGVRIGQVRDLVFDPDRRAIAALVVREGSWRKDAELVPVDRIRSFGRDAVTIHNLRAVTKARSNRDLYRLFASGVRLDGLLAMTEGGNYLGTVEEVILDDHAAMVAYEISPGFAKDVNQGKVLIPANELLTIGHDVASFPEGIESVIARSFPEPELTRVPASADGRAHLQPVAQRSA